MTRKFVGGAVPPPDRAAHLETEVAVLRKCLGVLFLAIPEGTKLELDQETAELAENCGAHVRVARVQAQIAEESRKQREAENVGTNNGGVVGGNQG